jgi:N-acetylglucosaminyl-diphospho-decaprenol L-rhamnosyltransferase
MGSMRAMASLGVAILSYRPGFELSETVRDVLASGVSSDRILIVDNDSPREMLVPVRSSYPDVHILVMEQNVGYGGAMNRAAADLRDRGCSELLFLTQETKLAAGALARLKEHLDSQPTLGLVGPLLGRLSAPGQVWSAGGTLTAVTGKPIHLHAGDSVAACAAGLTEVQWLDGACLLLREAAFREAGGFREDLFLYWEDVHIAREVRRAGWGVACATDALAFQEPSMTPPYLMARNRALVLGLRGMLGAASDVARWAARDRAIGRGSRAGLGAAGLFDALRGGRLDRSRALVRP